MSKINLLSTLLKVGSLILIVLCGRFMNYVLYESTVTNDLAGEVHATLWNKLPQSIRKEDMSITTFKYKLKELFKRSPLKYHLSNPL